MSSKAVKTSTKSSVSGPSVSSGMVVKKSKSKATSLQEKLNQELRGYQYINLSGMETNKPYLITGIKKSNTRFGDRLVAELEKTYRLYLPERYYTGLTERQIQELGGGQYTVTKTGLNDKTNNLHFIKLNEMVVNHTVVSNTTSQQISPTSPPPLSSVDEDRIDEERGADEDDSGYSSAFEPMSQYFYTEVEHH